MVCGLGAGAGCALGGDTFYPKPAPLVVFWGVEQQRPLRSFDPNAEYDLAGRVALSFIHYGVCGDNNLAALILSLE